MLAYHNNPDLKAAFVEQVRWHRDQWWCLGWWGRS
jgi:hypothetical protein